MISSLDDAIPILNKWREEEIPLHVFFAADKVGFNSVLLVRNIVQTAVGFTLELGAEHSQLLADLSEAKIEYGDPREAPGAVRPAASARYVSFLEFSWANKDLLCFFELVR